MLAFLALFAVLALIMVVAQRLTANHIGLSLGALFGDTGAVDTFIPEIWSKKLLKSLKKNLVYAGPTVVNTDYEGEIKEQGDTVRINSIGRPTIATYSKGVTQIVPEQLTAAQRALVIDQAKYFAFEVDDIDAAQTAGDLIPEAIEEAGYGLADVADQYVASLYTDAASANLISTVSVTTGALAYTQLRKLGQKLNEASVPQNGRYVVVPPWYYSLLLDEDKFVRVDASGTDEALRNGIVGRALGFDVLMSNNAPLITGDDYAIIAGVPGAISFAAQIDKTEAYRPQDSFSDAVKGLQLYGAKVVRPQALAVCTASIT